MFSEEWPLLLFTLFTQFAVGSYIFLVVIRSLKKIDRKVSLSMTKVGMLLVGPVMVVALILSVFHLGTPMGAYRAILNWDSSWLSREILFAGGFFALWIVGYVLERKGNWSQALGLINSIVGLGAVFSMSSIYATSIMPAWSDFNTFLSFFGTTMVFGATGSVISILLSKEEKTEQVLSILKITGMIGALAIVFQLVYLPVYISSLTASGAAGMQSAAVLSTNYFYTSILRWLLTIAGVGVLVYALSTKRQTKLLYQLPVAALTLVIVGEFIGRFLFYATGVPIIVG